MCFKPPENETGSLSAGALDAFFKDRAGYDAVLVGPGMTTHPDTEQLVNELIKQNKYFTMIDYPMRSHGINERENTTLHLRMTMLNYLKQNLPSGAQ